MDAQLNDQIEMQTKISDLVKTRQEQITALKTFFDKTTTKKYKEVIVLGPNLKDFENVFNKYEFKLKYDNILSLSLSLGKVIDLNNSVKTLLIALKIFEEHNEYVWKHKNLNGSKKSQNYISKLFSSTDSIPLTQNDFIKKKISRQPTNNTPNQFIVMRDFYTALYKNDSNFFIDFNKYLAFQTDSKSKGNNSFKLDEFQSKMGNFGRQNDNFKFYFRNSSSFELDYAGVVLSACDIIFMLYNKMMDKICYNKNLEYLIKKLDDEIVNNFINYCGDDLQKLSEYVLKKDMDDLIKNLDKIYE